MRLCPNRAKQAKRAGRDDVRDGALDVPLVRSADIAGEHGSTLHWENVVVECIVENIDFKNRMCYDVNAGLYLKSRIYERGVTVEKIRLWNNEASADGFGGYKKH